ncbi:MAG: hypothetical protein DHS20C13_29030 [Thermodesulfobacteriota bacterium]|nr:MAG: hypothetical protein DHS20C13_29030 [Thermodesulfobacteriota bacterium]
MCTECSDGYELKKGYCCRYGYKFDKKAKICVAEEDLDWEEFECPETLYLSNNWCCPENTYWNEEEHFCE